MTSGLVLATLIGVVVLTRNQLRRLSLVHVLLGRRSVRRLVARRMMRLMVPTVIVTAVWALSPGLARRWEQGLVDRVAGVLGRPSVRSTAASLAGRTRARRRVVRRWM